MPKKYKKITWKLLKSALSSQDWMKKVDDLNPFGTFLMLHNF